jgi:RNA polymerase sigma factor (sigma-70 family)
MQGSRKDFEVTIRLRNNQLKSRRMALGLSIIELCKLVHISPQSYMDLENLKVSPMYAKDHASGWQKGDWRKAALKLSTYYVCLPEELFPDAVRRVQRNMIVAEFDLAQLPQAAVMQASAMLPSPEAEYIAAETKQRLNEALDTLPPRDAEIMRLRYGLADGEEHSSVDIGVKFGLSSARILQIEARALKKLGAESGPAREALVDFTPPRKLAWEELRRLETQASGLKQVERTAHAAIAYAERIERLRLNGYHTGFSLDALMQNARVARNTLKQIQGKAHAAREKAKDIRKRWGFRPGIEYHWEEE